jgi:hypothetical protein
MKKILILLVVIIGLGACARQSDLTIYNDTGQSIQIILGSTIHQLFPTDPPAVETCYLNSFILFGETKEVPIIIYGQIYLEHKDFHMKMKPGKDRSYHVELDRAGIQISNPSIYPITDVQLKKEDGDWEYALGFPFSVFSEELSPTISVSADYDYIKIAYNIGFEQNDYIEDTIELNIGETTTYLFEVD